MIETLPLLAWPRAPLLSILIYHRVFAAPSALFPDEMDADRFDLQMGYLARNFAVMSLPDAVQGLKRGVLPRRACCITFDDGYADNLTVALPILERYGLPATLFVATGYMDGGCMFNDAVIEIIERTPLAVLDLQELGLQCFNIDAIERRQAAIGTILKKTRFLPPEQRNAIVKKIAEIAGIHSLPKDLMLKRAQVAELSRRGVEIGGHTVSHPVLSSLADSRAEAEIAEGKKTLEIWIGKPVSCFAYPVGLPGRDFTPEHARMVRDIGFDVAVTTATGVANRRSDIFQLPRFMPWDASVTKLGMRMMRNAWKAA